jgi:hypothetical protein
MLRDEAALIAREQATLMSPSPGAKKKKAKATTTAAGVGAQKKGGKRGPVEHCILHPARSPKSSGYGPSGKKTKVCAHAWPLLHTRRTTPTRTHTHTTRTPSHALTLHRSA